ncbi:SPOR domain-containing protein [Halopseudomonas sp.]|uniref:SPOR domain-containing protein n=1 Tax=Halopseudomonas sp. TaxID=2901191 RepID=UPI003001DB6E
MDEGLKQRIIGALVLIVAAVVFLPMLLSGQDETVEVVVDVPEQPVLDQQPIAPAEPVALPQPPQVPVIPTPDTSTEQASTQGVPVQPPAEPEPAAEAIPAAEEPVPDVPPTAAVNGDWVIQLGSFSSSSNAEGLSETLRKQGYNAYTHSVSVQGKPITRVYVGPLASRDAANRLRDELASKRGSKGLVVAYDADSGRG